MHSERRVVFVVGCPRSGTSVTKKILRRHSGLTNCGIEHHYILDLLDRFGESRFDYAEGLAVLARTSELAGQSLVETANEFKPPSPTMDMARFCELVWDASTQDDGRLPILLQYAGPGLLRAPELLQVFPRAKFVVLMRDPRANVSSQMLGLNKGRSIFRSTNLWKECRMAAASLSREFPEACLDVSYEALVADTEGWLRTICSFVGLPWEEGLTDFEVPMATIGVDGQTVRSSFDRLDPAMNEKWRQALTPAQVSLIETLCKSEMKSLGYVSTSRSLQIRDFPAVALDLSNWARARLKAAVS